MAEKVESAGPQAAVGPLGHALDLSAERLETRVAVLRARVRALVPEDQARLPHAGGLTDGGDGSLERIRGLELERLKAAGAVTEAARVAAEARAADAERRLALVEEELRARTAELARLRFRCEGFEDDLDALAAEVAMATAGAARATRLKRERDEARERAFTERQLAAQDRDHAAEAEGRVIQLQNELQAARGQLANVTEFNRRIEAVRESPRAPESVRTPWVELQHLAASADAPAASETREASQVEKTAGTEIVDLTGAEAAVKEQAPEEPVSTAKGEPLGAQQVRIDGGGLLRRLLSGRRPAPEPGG